MIKYLIYEYLKNSVKMIMYDYLQFLFFLQIVKYKSLLNNGEDIMLLGLDLVILEIFVIDLFVKNVYF